jgi:hypothetical protein
MRICHTAHSALSGQRRRKAAFNEPLQNFLFGSLYPQRFLELEMSFTPLEVVAEADLQDVCRYIWDWRLCGGCTGNPRCEKTTCPWNRRTRVQPALLRYSRLCSYYMPVSTTNQALRCHQDLLNIIYLIKEKANQSKEELMGQSFRTHIPISDQERAFNLAASILLSINCGLTGDHTDNLEDSEFTFPWTPGFSVTGFVGEAFRKNSTIQQTGNVLSIIGPGLTAKRLKDKTGLQFQPTDDMRSHLRIDIKLRVVYLFDCTAVLEEMLSATQNSSQDGILPRQMLFEILHTLYKVMFPPGRESENFASYLIKKHGFQEDFLRYKISWFKRDDDPEVDFSYFGDRLLELHNELEDPSPRNWFERLFEGGSKSAERKMLMATTIGVFIAVTIGLFGLVIAGFQAWVGYQQWKHPVKGD